MVVRKSLNSNYFSFEIAKFTFLIIASITVFGSAIHAAADLPISSYKDEPEVRIGVLLKVRTTTITLNGDYKVVNKESGQTLALGSGGTFTLNIEPMPAPELPGNLYRVTVGSYKSYEDASFARDKLAALGYPIRIAYPSQWYLWFGPYSSTEEARNVLDDLTSRGYTNALIEPVPLGRAGFTVRDSDGNVISTGTFPVLFTSSDNRITVGEIEYRGKAEALPDASGAFSIVNIVKVEDYLRSVVPREMPSGSHIEALKSQAIVARTYLLNNRSRHQEDGFELCGTTDCQVYGGVKAEVASTDKAVRGTRGMVVSFKGRIANALFFSTCGGRTANYNDIWTGDAPPYLVSVNDGADSGDSSLSDDQSISTFLGDLSGSCKNAKVYRWEVKKEKSEMQAILDETIPQFTNHPGLQIGELQNITVTDRGESGRVLKIDISTSTGDFTFERDTIRWVLGKLKSTMFTVELMHDENDGNDYFIFRGGGWGHSVGMCQMGAMQLAKSGMSFKEILKHYYPGSSISYLWK